MILTVLGGSAHSTPVLVQSLIHAFSDQHVLVRLVGRHGDRLRAVGRACRVLAEAAWISVEEYEWRRWSSALPGSDAVLVQIRPGNYEGRVFDESFPLDCDVPGDEGLGPGGFSAAWRSWPVVREIITGIRRHAPAAPVLFLTSPGSLLVRLAGKGVIGICELPWTTLCTICGDPEKAQRASFDYAGVNHIGWLYNVQVDGREQTLPTTAYFPSAHLVRRLGAWPLKYLRLHYCTAEIVHEQKRAPAARVRELMQIAERAFEVFTHGNRGEITAALRARRAEWYTDAVVPLMRSLRGYPIEIPLFLTVMEQDEVRERCYRAVGGKLLRQPSSAEPSLEVRETLDSFELYEKAAALAIEKSSEDLAADALALHPWVQSRTQAALLARRVVTQTKEISHVSA